jgi:hypothetical protein
VFGVWDLVFRAQASTEEKEENPEVQQDNDPSLVRLLSHDARGLAWKGKRGNPYLRARVRSDRKWRCLAADASPSFIPVQ